jgi:hypothetical protein
MGGGMKRVNLMTDASQFRSEARVYLRWWSFGLLGLVAALAPVSIWRWEATRRARAECDAREASYAPIRRLVKLNRDLREDAGRFVKDERLELELSRNQPMSALLNVVSAAAAESRGQLFVEHLAITKHAPHGDVTTSNAAATEEKIMIDAAAMAAYDIAPFVEALKKEPIKTVKVLSDLAPSPKDKDRKAYKLECTF